MKLRLLKRPAATNNSARVVLGLGNPGQEYRNTRHNAGFLVLDAVASELGLSFRRPLFGKYQIAAGLSPSGNRTVLVKPLTFMNLSGTVLPGLFRRFRLTAEDLIVVCDQLDLSAGAVRIKRGGGTGGPRGLRSVSEYLGSEDYTRLYLGVGKPPRKADVVAHVLGEPEGPERLRFIAGIESATDAVLRLLDRPIEEVMNEYNRRGGPAR